MSEPKILKVIIAVVISAVANMLIMLIVANWLIDLVTVTPQEIKQYEERMAAERLDRPINENGSFEITINQPGVTGSFNVSSIVVQEDPGTIGNPNIDPTAEYPFAVGLVTRNADGTTKKIYFCPDTKELVVVDPGANYSKIVQDCDSPTKPKTLVTDAIVNQKLNFN
ncbi:hypothetical protein [Microcystis sp. BLCC-F210]|uniref:hypothetical protein n=1 Tax=Microcystis sp. BLCC-F210 TaxID=3342751 RepID=UPI0035C88983